MLKLAKKREEREKESFLQEAAINGPASGKPAQLKNKCLKA
jgi:hypothetical protein